MPTYTPNSGGNAWAERRIVQPTVKRQPGRFRGPMSSQEYNDFQDAVVHDLINLSTAANANSNRIDRALRQLYLENSYLRRRVDALQEEISYSKTILAKDNPIKISKYLDFHDASLIYYDPNLPAVKRASYKAQFGEVFLPAKALENKFYNFSLRTGGVALPDDLLITAYSIFDKLDGKGSFDYEYGGTVLEGNPFNAFNGMNESAWMRSVSFPLDSDVSEVEVEINAVVPASISSKANLLEIVPFPEGSVDVTSISTSPDLGSAFVELDTFTPVRNASASRYHFSPRSVEQVRVRLRSRNWREINGKKVFTYGLQETGLKLVDYDKSTKQGGIYGEEITAIIQIAAPSGHLLGNIYRIDPTPNFFLEDNDKRHVRLRLSTTPDFAGIIWDSEINIAPQDAGNVGVSAQSASMLYAIYTLKFVESTGGFSSPYQIGCSPYARGLGLSFSGV
jgi:hypothetical protein